LGNTNYAAATQVTRSVSAILATQTITFTTNPPASAAFNGSFTVAATATSGLAVTFTSSGGCGNTGATYTMTSATIACSVIANQLGDTNYAAAPQLTQSVSATVATQTIAFAGTVPASVVFGSGAVTLAATSNAPSPSFTFGTTSAASICTVSGTSVTLAGVGPCVLTVTAAATGNYAAVTTAVTQTLTIRAATQTIAFAGTVPAITVFGSGAVTLSATSNAPSPTFTFGTTSAASICTVSGTSVTLVGVGPCVLTVTAAATGNYAAVTTPITQTLTISKATPAISWTAPGAIAYGTALSGVQLNATATIPGAFVYNPPAGTVLPAGNGQILSVTFTPTDTADYTTGSGTVAINVNNALYSLTTSSSPPAGGSIAATVGGLPAGSNVAAGSLVTVTAVPNAGYAFANFSGALTGTTSPQSFTIGSPATVIANFTALAPQLAVSSGIASVSGANVTVPLTVTNSGLGAGANVTITGVSIVSFTGTGPVTVASNSGVIGTIGVSSSGSASVVFSWPNGAALKSVKYKVSLSADGGYTTTSSTITTLY
jgi:hypothetical protein